MVRETAYEKVTRNMVENLSKTMETGFSHVNAELVDIKKNQQELFNHQSKRLPMWTTIMITFLCSLVTGLIVWGISR